jgi:hypothetical protein
MLEKKKKNSGDKEALHLSGGDNRLAGCIALADHHLLCDEDLLHGKLDAKVSASHLQVKKNKQIIAIENDSGYCKQEDKAKKKRRKKYRGTMIPSDSASTASKFCTPSMLSILEIIIISFPSSPKISLISCTSSGFRTKDAATISTPKSKYLMRGERRV